MTASWRTEISRRMTGDGTELFSIYIRDATAPVECRQGMCGYLTPAYSRAEVVTAVTEILDDIRAGRWNRPDTPMPRPENMELVDDTGLFSLADFFGRRTLAAFAEAGTGS